MNECYKMIGIMNRLSVNLSRDALLRIYKSFIRPYLDYGDIIYDKASHELFKNKIKNIQYKACIARTGAIQERSTMVQQTYTFYKIVNVLAPKYLTNYLNTNYIPVYKTTASQHNNIKKLEQ